MQLRPYQREALDKLREWLFEPTNNGKHPIVEASVGAGKSVMIAALIQELIEHIPQL
jgi:superfamily II DNA or RNA helicase